MISSSVKARAKATRSGNSLRLEVQWTFNASFVASALTARASFVQCEKSHHTNIRATRIAIPQGEQRCCRIFCEQRPKRAQRDVI